MTSAERPRRVTRVRAPGGTEAELRLSRPQPDDSGEAGLPGADPEYAGIYLHARYFDPQLGTFLSPDPIGVAGGMNQYAYALGDPANGTDRSGLMTADCSPDEGCHKGQFTYWRDAGNAATGGSIVTGIFFGVIRGIDLIFGGSPGGAPGSGGYAGGGSYPGGGYGPAGGGPPPWVNIPQHPIGPAAGFTTGEVPPGGGGGGGGEGGGGSGGTGGPPPPLSPAKLIILGSHMIASNAGYTGDTFARAFIWWDENEDSMLEWASLATALPARGRGALRSVRAQSPFWRSLRPFRGRTRTDGERFFEWDHRHGDIEVYDGRGRHLGTAHSDTGLIIKPPVKGRRIPL